MYVVHNGSEEIVNVSCIRGNKGFLYNRPYTEKKSNHQEPDIISSNNHNDILLRILSNENVCSRKPIYEKYDKQVQGRTYTETGIADAGVMAPFNSSQYPEEIRRSWAGFIHRSQPPIWSYRPILVWGKCSSGGHAEMLPLLAQHRMQLQIAYATETLKNLNKCGNLLKALGV